MLKYCLALLISAVATYSYAEGFGGSEEECKNFAESVCTGSAGVDQECFSRIYNYCRLPLDIDPFNID